ncbi:MAG TPA: winged helix-turn-helix domain-containing protein [Candidatus Acidoferrum sp.]
MSLQTPNSLVAKTDAADARDPYYLKLRDLVYQSCGIYHSEEKLYLLAGACKRRMAEIKSPGAREYLDVLSRLNTRDAELRNLLNEITIGETCLFRSQGQIDALKNVLLPKLVEERSKLGLKKLRIWSAGCSTGEEPYTLAMFLNEEREKRYPQWNFEVMVMDRLSHSVHRCGHAIDLSPKEFALLEFLMRHAGHPVSRSTIVEQVWRLNVETMTNVVDVYVNYLRRKVDSGYDRRLIRTVRGTGYQIGTSGLAS